MNKKRIILSVIVFLCAFLITIIVKFPLNAVVSNIIADTVKNRKIDIRYDSINVTFFGSTATNVKSGPIVIKNIELDYNPLGLLFKRVSFKAQSDAFILNGKLSGNNLNADVKVSIASLAQMVNMTGSGSFTGNITYNIKNETGKINLDAPNKISFNHPLMPLQADNLKANADIDKNKLTINDFSATGQNTLKVTGYVDLNKQKIDTSILNIKGEASMGNYPLKFTLTGPARMPKVAVLP